MLRKPSQSKIPFWKTIKIFSLNFCHPSPKFKCWLIHACLFTTVKATRTYIAYNNVWLSWSINRFPSFLGNQNLICKCTCKYIRLTEFVFPPSCEPIFIYLFIYITCLMLVKTSSLWLRKLNPAASINVSKQTKLNITAVKLLKMIWFCKTFALTHSSPKLLK